MNFTLDSKIWQASPWKLKIWIYLFEQANRIDNTHQGLKIKRGQILRSYGQIAKDCSYKIGYRTKTPTISAIRKILKEFIKEERITQRRTPLGTLFSICNYEALRAFPKARRTQRSEQSEELASRSTDDETTQQIDELIKLYENKFPGHVQRIGRKAIFKMRDIIEGAHRDGISFEAIRERIEEAKDGTPWKIVSEKWIAKSTKEEESHEKLIRRFGVKDS